MSFSRAQLRGGGGGGGYPYAHYAAHYTKIPHTSPSTA